MKGSTTTPLCEALDVMEHAAVVKQQHFLLGSVVPSSHSLRAFPFIPSKRQRSIRSWSIGWSWVVAHAVIDRSIDRSKTSIEWALRVGWHASQCSSATAAAVGHRLQKAKNDPSHTTSIDRRVHPTRPCTVCGIWLGSTPNFRGKAWHHQSHAPHSSNASRSSVFPVEGSLWSRNA